MLKSQQNKLIMYEAVHSYLKENEIAFSELEELVNGMNELKTKKDEIHAKEDQRMNSTKGKQDLKSETRKTAVTAGNSIAGALFAFAKKSKNVTLANKSNISITGLSSMRDLELVIFLNSLRELTRVNLQSLSPFGITEQKYAEYEQKINDYFEALTTSESSRAVRSSASKSLATLIKETDDVLKSIDKLVESFRDENKQFYNGYRSSRSIRDLGMRHKKLPESNATGTSAS
jgi:hypothetical protein